MVLTPCFFCCLKASVQWKGKISCFVQESSLVPGCKRGEGREKQPGAGQTFGRTPSSCSVADVGD